MRRVLRLPDEREIAYLDGGAEGDHRPPLVLVHGIGASKDHWPRLARRLQDRVRVVAPDLPGFGESSRPEDADYGSAGQARVLRLFVEALGLGRFHLGGSSMGGRIAAVYAAQRPGTLRSLALLAPGGAASGQPSEMVERLEHGGRVPLFARDAGELAEVLRFTMSCPPDVPRLALRVLAAEAAEGYDLHRRIFDVYREEHRSAPPTEEVLRGLAVPTLVIWGDEDRVLDASAAEGIARAPQRASLHRMEGVGHLPMLEDPGATAAIFRAFLDEHDAAGAE